jgi:hypothetical protein
MPGLSIIEPIGQIELEWQGTTLPLSWKTGMRVTTDAGAVYRLVKNELGSTLTNRLAYILRVNASGELAVGAAGDDALSGCVGIVQLGSVANGTYFWIGTGGFLTYTSAGAIAANATLSLSTTDGKLDDAAITGKFLNLFNGNTAPGAADVAAPAYCPAEMFYVASN